MGRIGMNTIGRAVRAHGPRHIGPRHGIVPSRFRPFACAWASFHDQSLHTACGFFSFGSRDPGRTSTEI
jgi:hypothetical protein